MRKLVSLLSFRSPSFPEIPSAVDDQIRACDEACFVGTQVDGGIDIH